MTLEYKPSRKKRFWAPKSGTATLSVARVQMKQ